MSEVDIDQINAITTEELNVVTCVQVNKKDVVDKILIKLWKAGASHVDFGRCMGDKLMCEEDALARVLERLKSETGREFAPSAESNDSIDYYLPPS